MLRSASELIGYTIHATDGDIGSVTKIFFDDERWTVRYVVVDTGKRLPGRKVLISPISIRQSNWSTRTLDDALTREQVKNSPDVETDRPVSRQHEIEHFGYYGYPYYWAGSATWGMGIDPRAVAEAQTAGRVAQAEEIRDRAVTDSHLRDATVVTGYHIHATDGEIGHVEDFLIDDHTWMIRYLVIDTSNWIGGRRVLISPQWVRAVSWELSEVHLKVTREAVRTSPEYDPMSLNREYEERLYSHYGQMAYWIHEAPGRRTSGTTSDEPRFARLEDLPDFEVADGDPDVRGWKVLAADGVVVGQVEHLIVDREAMKVRYLEVELAGRQDPSGDVLIPIEHVDIDDRNEQLRFRAMGSSEVSALPRHVGFPIDSDYERRLRTCFTTTAATVGTRREVRLRSAASLASSPMSSAGVRPPIEERAPQQEQVVNRSSDPRDGPSGDRTRDPRLEDEDSRQNR